MLRFFCLRGKCNRLPPSQDLQDEESMYVVVDGDDGTGHDKDDLDSRRGASAAILRRNDGLAATRWQWCGWSASDQCAASSAELSALLDDVVFAPVGETSTDATPLLT